MPLTEFRIQQWVSKAVHRKFSNYYLEENGIYLNVFTLQGHATAQSTGVGGHHASRFIPTVEREALDLV